MKNFRDENGITLIKLIIIVFVIAALIGCYSFLTSNDNKVVFLEEMHYEISYSNIA